jgi:tetratricopeptide (TPR) repeat protein
MESHLQAAVARDPKFAEAWALLSWVHGHKYAFGADHTPGRFAKSKAAIDTAVSLAPDLPDIVHNLGVFYLFAFRDYAKAREQFERMVRLQPNNADAIYSLGGLDRREGRWASALGLMRRSTQLDPGNLNHASQLASLLEAGRRYEEATTQRRRISALSPADLDQRFSIARNSFWQTGAKTEMERFFAGLNRAQAGSDSAIRLKADWARMTGKLAEYTSLHPSGVRGTTLAIALAAQGDLAGARAQLGDPAQLRLRLASEPDNHAVWASLSEIQVLLGHHDEALRSAQKAVELLPESLDTSDGPALASTLAFIYAWSGDRDRAIAQYARLLRTPFSRLNVHEMKLAPEYAPLRADPRFEALLNDPKNNAPLF